MFAEKFLETIKNINEDEALKSVFVSTRQGSRVFNIISTNVKNLNTLYTYYEDVTFHPEYDNHQKLPCCTKLKVYGENDDVKTRGSLLHKFGQVFTSTNAFPRAFFAILLMMNSNYNLHSGSEYLYNILPDDLIDDFDEHLGDFLKVTDSSIKNPIMGIFSLYSNEDALFSYIDLYNNELEDFENTVSTAETSYTCISKRISNCQRSTFPVEAVIFSMYSMFAQMRVIGMSYSEIVDCIVAAYENKIESIGAENINGGSIFKTYPSDVDKIKDFFLSLDSEEQIEILKCFGVSIPSNEEKTKKSKKLRMPHRPNKTYINRGGKDVYRTCKSRSGQSKFRKALIDQEGVSCAIPGCKVCGEEHIIASHIVEWNQASELEKTDPNNGLVLCPNHDHLFDNHYISFDSCGKIMISGKLSAEELESFGLNSEIVLDLSPERELYMIRHRKKLN